MDSGLSHNWYFKPLTIIPKKNQLGQWFQASWMMLPGISSQALVATAEDLCGTVAFVTLQARVSWLFPRPAPYGAAFLEAAKQHQKSDVLFWGLDLFRMWLYIVVI